MNFKKVRNRSCRRNGDDEPAEIETADINENTGKKYLKAHQPLRELVIDSMERWFANGCGRAEEKELEKFLIANGEEAIRKFVELIEEDRGESIGPWRIPPKDFDDPETMDKLPACGSLLCVSVEKDSEGRPIPYYMPRTIGKVKEQFENERVRKMAQVAIQRALGRKIVIDVGIGFVGTAEILVGSSAQMDIPPRDYGNRQLKYRPPLSGENQYPVFSIGYEPLGNGTYRQDMLDRGLVGLRADDPTVKPTAEEAHKRGNMAATFLPEILAVCDYALLSIPQHPYKTLPGHPESIFADPGDGLEVIKTVAGLLPKNAACIVESTVFPYYMELFAIPEFEGVFRNRRIPEEDWPSLCYSFQRMEPGIRWLQSNRDQVRMGGASTVKGRQALADYFDLIGYDYSISNKVVAAEHTKDLENAFRYQVIASTAPFQEIFEELGFDIYKMTREIAAELINAEIENPKHREVLFKAIESLRSPYETALHYSASIKDTEEQARFLGNVLSIFSKSITSVLNQAILFPGGYCVIEQIGHLIYGMVATKLIEELDVKVIFQPALATISAMRLRQHDLACWIVSELAGKGVDPRDAAIWAGGVTYMPQIEDARNGALEFLMRMLADMGVTDWTVYEPYASRWDQIQRQDAFSPESEGYGLTRQTWLRGISYIYGQRLIEKGKLATEDRYETIDPHTSMRPDMDVLILSMDHPQLVGKHQPEMRRTDGKGVIHPGLDAVKVSARMLAREGRIILDTHNFLADEDIREFLALGWKVRGLGRGHIAELKEKVDADERFMIQVTERLLEELKNFGNQGGIEKERLDEAIAKTTARLEYLKAPPALREQAGISYFEAAEKQESAYHKRYYSEESSVSVQALKGVISREVESSVEKLQTHVQELSFLAKALSVQINRGSCARPEKPENIINHIQRLDYLIELHENLLKDCGLAVEEMFVKEAKQAFESFRATGEEKSWQNPHILSSEDFKKTFISALRDQYQGISASFQHASEVVGPQMGDEAQEGSVVQLILKDRPISHNALREHPGVIPDPELHQSSKRLADWFRIHGKESRKYSPLEARAAIFSYEANSGKLDSIAVRNIHRILAELAIMGISPQDARAYIYYGTGKDTSLRQNKTAEEITKLLKVSGCNCIDLSEGEDKPFENLTPAHNLLIMTDHNSASKLDVVGLTAKVMGGGGKFIFDANNCLTREQILELLALDWRVAGAGRNDIYGSDTEDIKGITRHLPGLIDDVTSQDRLDVHRRLLGELEYRKATGNIDQTELESAITKVKLKIERLESKHLEDNAEPIGEGYDRKVAFESLIRTVVEPLERELSGILEKVHLISKAFSDQLEAGNCKRPSNSREVYGQLRKLSYIHHLFDDSVVDCARASDVLFSLEGQAGVRDTLDLLKKESRGSRLELPAAKPPQEYADILRHAPMTPELLVKEKERLLLLEEVREDQELATIDLKKNNVTDEEALNTLRERFWGRFTQSGDIKVLPALKMHQGEDGRHIEITVDPNGELVFTSLRFVLDAAKGKDNNPIDWIKYSCLVPLYIVDVTPPPLKGERPRDFDYFITQELLRSTIPWRTKQRIVTEVMSRGRILTTIRAEGAEPCRELAVLMQGNPYADVGAPKDAGGSGRAGFLVSTETDRPELVITKDAYGRERLIEIKSCGPMFGTRTQDVINTMVRRIAGGQTRDKSGKITVGMTTLSQLYGLVRGPQVDQLLKLYGQPLRKEKGAPSGVCCTVFHTLPWDAPDVLVGQVWRLTPSSWRLGFMLNGDDEEFDASGLASQLGFGTAEMLFHYGDSINVHIAHGLDNNRLVGVKPRPLTTREGETFIPEIKKQVRGYPTDEDSLVNTADERDPFAAFNFYFDWTLTFVLFGYDNAKGGRLENPDYTYFPDFMEGFTKHLSQAPIIRKNQDALSKFRQLCERCRSAENDRDFEKILEELRIELRDVYMAYRVLRLRIENGFNAKADSAYTSNAGRNFRRGRLTAKGPSRQTAEKLKPSAHEEALEFLQAETRVLDLAEEAVKRGGYPPLNFDFEAARKALSEKFMLIAEIADREKQIVSALISALGWEEIEHEEAYRELLKIDEAAPELELLEHIPSYERVYELNYYQPRAGFQYAKINIPQVYRGGTRPLMMGSGTVHATRTWDKAAAQKQIAEAGLAQGRKLAGIEEIQEATCLESIKEKIRISFKSHSVSEYISGLNNAPGI